tara:strand:- start:761 stop:1090 length:330 start_codon:yes stop_codon:yes gene_type:complete
VTHIQNIAPGPPKEIAIATPLIFPIPTIPAIWLETLSKEVIPFSELLLLLRSLNECLKYNMGVSLDLIEKYNPPPISNRTKIGPFHKTSAEVIIRSEKNDIKSINQKKN